MRKIMGKMYLTDKEASERYGYSQSWFRRARISNTGPKFIQLMPLGRVLYALEETDEWFKQKLRENE